MPTCGGTQLLRHGVVLLAVLLASCIFGSASALASTVFGPENWTSGTPDGWTAADTSATQDPSDPTWQILNNPQSVSVANPGINPNLVTLPDAGSLPSAFVGTHAAWFGDTTSGTYCGADWNTYDSTPNTTASKNGCTSREPFSGTLTSPTFSLAGAASATLHFFAWWEIEAVDADTFDLMQVEYSINGGETWSSPIQLNPASNPAGQSYQSYSNNGLETSPSWHEYLVDLSGAAGSSSVQVRFVFDTRDNLYNGYRGWLIDNVSVNSPYDAGTPAISSVEVCSGGGSAPVTIINGSNFVEGSQVLVDGSAVSSAVESSSRIELPALDAGTHTIQVQSPNGSLSNAVQVTAGNCSSAAAPSVSAGPPVVSGPNGAGLSGSVDPEGLATTAYFEYGIDLSKRGPGSSTTLYDQTTPVQQVGSDFSGYAISASLSGLVPNVTYHARLVATNGLGTTFGPDQTFTTAKDPPPPPPVLGKTVNASPVSGVVFIKPPPGKSLGGAGDRAELSKGQGFVPLTEARSIPIGSQVDALHGSLKIVTATGKVGKTQNATLAGGVFKISQSRSKITKGLTNLSLVEGAFTGAPTYATCKAKGKGKKAADQATAAALSSKTLQLLKASAHGKFKTTGRYSSATVRGTIWTIADRCNGTLTHAIRDTVLVQDFVRHKTIVLHAGHSYLAAAIAKHK